MHVTNSIHPTAIVHSSAKIYPNVHIGPYSIIEAGVEIGEGTVIGNHVTISGSTIIGKNNKIYHSSSIGEDPQDMKFANEDTRLKIGDNNLIREFALLIKVPLKIEMKQLLVIIIGSWPIAISRMIAFLEIIL